MSLATAPLPTAPHWIWRSGTCRALSHTFEVRVGLGTCHTRVMDLVSRFRVSGNFSTAVQITYDVRIVEEGYSLAADGELVGRGRSMSELMGLLAWRINRAVIRTSVADYVLMHSAAVTRGGATVILPADMEAGKSTTAAGLLRAGYAYVTDEAVAIDPLTGRIHAFPKMLSLDPGSWHLFPEAEPRADRQPIKQWQIAPPQLGSTWADELVAPPRLVVFPQYRAGADTVMSPMSPPQALRALALTTFHFPDHAHRNLRVLARLVSSATCARLTIGHLDDAVREITSLLESTTEETP